VSVEIERALGRIEGKLDLLVPAMEAQEKRLSSVSNRVSKIEKHEKYVMGFSAAVALIAAKLGLMLK
jgi:hypothetical protein